VEGHGGTKKPHMWEECRRVWYGWSREQSREVRSEERGDRGVRKSRLRSVFTEPCRMMREAFWTD